MNDPEFLMLIRQALLLMVDAIERKLNMPRTAELRREKRPASCVTPPDEV